MTGEKGSSGGWRLASFLFVYRLCVVAGAFSIEGVTFLYTSTSPDNRIGSQLRVILVGVQHIVADADADDDADAL